MTRPVGGLAAWVATLVVGGLAGWGGHLLGAPDLLSVGIGVVVGGSVLPIGGRGPAGAFGRWLARVCGHWPSGPANAVTSPWRAWGRCASAAERESSGGSVAKAERRGHESRMDASGKAGSGEPQGPDGRMLDLGSVISAPPQATAVVPGQRFLMALEDLEHHVTTLGATGSGKTTTLGRFMDTALEAGWPVIVVDAKGGRLAEFSRWVAARHTLTARIWLPGDPDSWSYDVCAGEPTAVANRLVGAFEHGPNAAIYRNLSQAILPLVAQALQISGLGCNLDMLRRYLDRARLVGLARRVADPNLNAELLGMDEDLYRRALAGLSGRLAALRHGTFGPWLVPSPRTLDLPACLDEPAVTYFGLPATGASEDVALVGRVLVQHLKQLCYQALRTSADRRALIVVDEFASLGEAGQLVDLLLQAREARLAIVVSSQFIPRTAALRHAVLGAGALVVHQLGSAEDADLVARTLGTRSTVEIARQVQLGPPLSVRRLLRPAAAYLVSPDDLRRLHVGQAVVCVRHGRQRIAIVQIEPLRL
jgi:conjugal transfer pilus assembly protein TraD